MDVDTHSTLSEFTIHVRREMRRADRTRTPLSLALFRVGDEGEDGDRRLARLWDIVRSSSRETDLPMRTDHGLVIVMLLDTDGAGADAFLRKILAQASDLTVSTIAQEYPGHLFQNLLAGNHDDFRASPAAVRGYAPQWRIAPTILASLKPRSR